MMDFDIMRARLCVYRFVQLLKQLAYLLMYEHNIIRFKHMLLKFYFTL
jgi:hypothetical protein